ncbi:hypothetical protein QTG54_011702 [Skeletonema marinoi]|uniref:Uncharacterized protein n=1 Tax=Skeletonema marinoi TaxID=267567 RepID=A0AAD8Y226_9STRA|nr:hypothetical protein QTG54_011702 [Skeletonema marinoi]
MDITNGDVAATQQHHDATKRSDHDDSSSNQNQSIHDDDVSVSSIIALSELDPPPSRSEILRDKWLESLSGKIHFWVGVTVMALIIIDGAFFFFLLVGAQNMCTPRTNCNPRNWWYNFSIQFLNVLFTYLATVSLPWRLSNTAHLFNGSGKHNRRSSDAGLDLYGRPTEKIWYHISQSRRRIIVFFLILNSLTQYANQATRIIYYSFELQNVFPGTLWTNLFFMLSMMCAAVAGVLQIHAEMGLRKVHPERFPPTLFETLGEYLTKVRNIRRRTREEGGDEEEPTRDGDVEEDRRKLERGRSFFVRNINSFFSNVEPSLGLWGL